MSDHPVTLLQHPGLVIEAQDLNPHEIREIEQKLPSLAQQAKNVTGRLFLSKAEKQELKEIHLQITRHIGQGYAAKIQMAVDREVRKMQNALYVQNMRKVGDLLHALVESLDMLGESVTRAFNNRSRTIHSAVEEARQYTNVPYAEEFILRWGKRSMQRIEDEAHRVEQALWDGIQSTTGVTRQQLPSGRVSDQDVARFVDEVTKGLEF